MDSPKPRKTKLTLKHRQFVMNLLDPNKTQGEAYAAAYGTVNSPHNRSMASQLIKKPQIQEHINDCLARLFPDLTSNAATVLSDMITDPNKSDQVKLKALELLAKFQGWAASTKVDKRVLTANVDLSKFKLPGGSND